MVLKLLLSFLTSYLILKALQNLQGLSEKSHFFLLETSSLSRFEI